MSIGNPRWVCNSLKPQKVEKKQTLRVKKCARCSELKWMFSYQKICDYCKYKK